ncbi:MAG: EthD domain-containing protein [Akkermansiaceae bacterium]|nr:EthD domain-containing protein [Akkermansiaceae bacterium]NNM28189.1 EthD domain-containing protein [Akkermansiaceae bacterium]
MVKLVYCVHRSPGMSPEEFRGYWYDNHGPLVKGFAEALHAHRYVQSHLINSPLNEVARQPRGTLEPFDGITEVWFADHDQLAAALQTPEAQDAHRTLIEDEARFCDLSRSTLFLTEEHVIFDH